MTQAQILPMDCFAINVVVHRGGRDGAWALGIEVTNPHDGELVGLVMDPTRAPCHTAQVLDAVLDELRAVLLDLLDPEPFPHLRNE